jgi:hypothetical protein
MWAICLPKSCVVAPWLHNFCLLTKVIHFQGLVFFNWYDKQHNKKPAEYIWSGSDWPSDGWACSESTRTPTPAATLISPSARLGRRGPHLGSHGATIGVSSLAKPGRDLTGGGAFGIPGYAGIGASRFGWGEPDEFEDFVDPPATLENIHSRALSRHPSLPFLLVGSSNTHVYLWEVNIPLQNIVQNCQLCQETLSGPPFLFA